MNSPDPHLLFDLPLVPWVSALRFGGTGQRANSFGSKQKRWGSGGEFILPQFHAPPSGLRFHRQTPDGLTDDACDELGRMGAP